MKEIKASIIGAAGYTGGELIRILLNHPAVKLESLVSRSQEGKQVSTIHSDLAGETELSFSSGLTGDEDLVFLCLAHGEAAPFLQKTSLPLQTRIIDLSQDFRHQDTAKTGGAKFIYGLPEWNRDEIKKGSHIANPGCFATAIQLGLLPLAKAGLLGEVHTTGITGSTGAGASLSSTSHFSWRANNIQAYKSLSHQHLKEISETLASAGSKEVKIHFVPWRGDFARGIFISSVVSTEKSEEEIVKLYKEFYRTHPFTAVVEDELHLKQVVNTNKCLLQVQKVDDKLVIHSALDNLLKGASGQAVQNMNLMFGLEETTGLKFKPSAF